MQHQNKEAFVRKRVIVLSFVCRVLVIAAAIILHLLNLLEDEFKFLILLLIPLSVLYLTVFIKFILQNRYERAGEKLHSGYIGLGFFTLLFFNIAELLLIIWKGLDNTVIEPDSFFLLISVFEGLFGIFAGLYLTELFKSSDKV